MAVPTEITGPKGYPLIGNMLDLQDDVPLHAIERMADIYGPIFKFNVPGRQTIIVSNFELFDELCDETRFYKLLGGKLADEADKHPERPNGLFSQSTEKEEDWGQAHRILMPAFGPLAIADMFDGAFFFSSLPLFPFCFFPSSSLLGEWLDDHSEAEILVVTFYYRNA